MTPSNKTVEEIILDLVSPTGPFSIGKETVHGFSYTVFTKQVKENLGDFFHSFCVKNWGSEFLVYYKERYTFGRVWEETLALAEALVLRFGLKKGDRVAISARNLPEWIISFMAAAVAGLLPVAVNSWWVGDELAYGLSDCGALVFIGDHDRLLRLSELKSDAVKNVAVKYVVGVRTDLQEVKSLGMKVIRYTDVISPSFLNNNSRNNSREKNAAPDFGWKIERDDLAALLYTSGSTNLPKGVELTHRNFLTQVTFNAFAGSLVPTTSSQQPQDALILTVPLFHVTGLVHIFLPCFVNCRKLVIMHKWNATEALEIIEREHVTSFTGVPTMTYELLHHPDFSKYNTSSLRTVGGGGAPTPEKQVRMVSQRFKNGEPSQGYGLTETTGAVLANVGATYVERPLSTGKPSFLVEIKIVEPQPPFKTLPPDTPGEVWIRSVLNMRGYWNKPEATKEVITADGWFRSGDLGKMDKDGFVYILDRVKQIIIRGGENISCSTVETAVYEHPDILEAAAIGVPDDRLGEEVGIAVVVKPGKTITLADIQAVCRGKIASYMIPTHLFVWKEAQLPRGATGKIQKREIIDSVRGSGNSNNNHSSNGNSKAKL